MIDVGAHLGEYGLELRREGCEGRILSVEPIKSSYSALVGRTGGDPLWDCVNAALGSSEGKISIHVAGNLVSSSILPMTATHSDAMPPSMYRGTETVPLRRLDDLADEYGLLEQVVAVKLDVQGYEGQVLEGGEKVLLTSALLECEVSFVELYEGQPLATDILRFMADRGFRPVGLRQGFTNPKTDEALQADMLFARVLDSQEPPEVPRSLDPDGP